MIGLASKVMRDLVTDRGQAQAMGAAEATQGAAAEFIERARQWIKRRSSGGDEPNVKNPRKRKPT